ncbi:MAG TPA: beta-galactosidase family protein [Acidobacteriaceae bacterium]|jgi:beta-galactosidase|nr:beta-galactosidase family protein [Acidobacteriaceae bacterium]
MRRTFVHLLILSAASLLTASAQTAPAASALPAQGHSFRAEHGRFLLNGKPFRIISGSIHYARVPRAYWRDRLRMAKAMGLNTVTTYVFWNVHEPRPGVYDFSGNLDVAEFVREAQQEGLYVILRPGPYACAEWEFGGFPSWLLKDPSTVVRSHNPAFLAAAQAWLLRLGRELAPLQIGNGGPIIAVQVENEYGSYGDDHAYMQDIRQMLVDAGFTQAQLYTADGAEELARGNLPDLPAAINFGPGEAQKSFAILKQLRPDGPFMNAEYWDGWFDHWGAPHAHTSTDQQTADLDWILRQGYSISIYMFHGGTSFGWMNGANSNGKNYEPDVTSYDYDAALDESGHPTPKFYRFRTIIARDTGITPPPVPTAPPFTVIPAFPLNRSASLWDHLPASVHSDQPLTMEQLDQAYGYVLYRTTVAGPVNGYLTIGAVHDYAQVYVDGKLAGTIDRRLNQTSLPLHIESAHARLDILLENTGRVNFGPALPGERVGLLGGVRLAGKPITGWENFSLPMVSPEKLAYDGTPCTGPCFYQATFTVDHPEDTFLDTSELGKGMVWINGRPLGRSWRIGPQKALYLPGPWLHPGKNEVVVFDLQGQPSRTLRGLDHPVLDAPIEPGS